MSTGDEVCHLFSRLHKASYKAANRLSSRQIFNWSILLVIHNFDSIQELNNYVVLRVEKFFLVKFC